MNTRTPLLHTAVPRRASRHALSRFSRPLATLGGALALCAASSVYAAPFKAGDIVVSRIGDGSAALGTSAAAIFLDEYTTSGTRIQSIALPTTATTSGNRALTGSGSAVSEGVLTLSSNGQYLTMGGYNAVPTTSTVKGTTSDAVNRVVGRIDAQGNINTTTALSDAYSTDNFRSVASTDGVTFYLGGTGTTASSGVRTTSLAATTTTQIESTVSNIRVTNLFNNQVYFSTGSGTVGIYRSNGDGTATNIAATGTGSSPYDFVFADANTIYVADDRTSSTVTGNGGLLKFTNSGNGFALVNTFNIANLAGTGTVGLRGLTIGPTGNIFAVSTDNRLVTINTSALTANGVAAFTTVATAGANTAFRGVDFAPQVSAVPEPGLMLGFSMGAGLLGMVRLRSRKRLA